MTTKRELPPRVFAKGRWFYLVTAEGQKRIWTKLTLQRDGLPALYLKLADLAARDIAPDRMPALVADWLREVSITRSTKTQANDRWVMNTISESFNDFRASQVTPPDVATFLRPLRAKPRTHNEMRAGLRELMRYAEELGHRPAGSNPVAAIKPMQVKARERYPTDSEVRRIKAAAMRGNDGKRTRMGVTLCLVMELAYLTGQRISDLLDLRWSKARATKNGAVVAPYLDDEGLFFRPSKTAGSTGAKVLIEWTPKLKANIERFRQLGRRSMTHVVTSQEAQPWDYEAFKSAWARAVERSGVADIHFHDLRAKALTDVKRLRGKKDAQAMAAHSTEQQTNDYVREREAVRVKATR